MKKVLIITDVDFWMQGAGHRMRISALVSYLSANTNLTIAYMGIVPPDQLVKINKQSFELEILNNEQLLSPVEYGSRLEAFLQDKTFDAVIIEYIHLSYMLNFVDEYVLSILDAHDIISERSEEFKKFNYQGAIHEMSAETEVEIFQVYDHVMVLCQPDHDKLQGLLNGKVLLCPHPNEVHLRELRAEASHIGYLASEYLPNVDAINYFISNCWESISREYEGRLSIYGNVCHMIRPVAAYNIDLKGFIPDLKQVYNEADIMINPIRFGAGMKIKNIEALANGMPLVTTSHGARGLEALSGKGFLVADSAEEFIDKVFMLIKDRGLRQQLSRSATDFIAEHFSAEKCFGPLLNVINHPNKLV